MMVCHHRLIYFIQSDWLFTIFVFLFSFFFFFFNDTATTEIYTLSLHDALPIYLDWAPEHVSTRPGVQCSWLVRDHDVLDRKSTRLNSSHSQISYAVFCLKKKKQKNTYLKMYSNTRVNQLLTKQLVIHLTLHLLH